MKCYLVAIGDLPNAPHRQLAIVFQTRDAADLYIKRAWPDYYEGADRSTIIETGYMDRDTVNCLYPQT